MDESGGRGQPRSGNEESADRHAGAPARATDPTPAGERPPHGERLTPEHDTAAPARDTAAGSDAPGRDEKTPPAAGPAAPAHDPDAPARDTDAPARDTDAPGGDAEAPARGSASPVGASSTTPGEPTGAEEHRAPTAAEHGEGGSPETDAHPDRSYAGEPHTGPHSARPEAHPRQTPAGAPHTGPGSARPEADPRQTPQAPPPGVPDRFSKPSAGHHPTEPPTEPPASGPRHLAHSADGKGPAPQRPPGPRGGLLMGRPFGVPVYVAPSWFLVAALITWVFGGQLERVLPELGAARYLVSLFFAVAFYASVLVHELAHTVAALRFKLPVRRIQLQFFGGVSEIEKEAETPGREFWLAFVGPLLSLALAGVFYGGLQAVEPGTVPGVLLAGLMISNLIVAAFNLLPGLPLDGGRMLRAVVWKLTGKPMNGTIAAAWVGRALAVCVLIGLPLLTQSGALGSDAVDNVGMDTVLDALLAAILAAIIWTGAGNSLRMARLREHLPELRARALTRRAVPVETDTPLSEALRRANAAGARALVVVDADGHPLSLVREAAIVGVPEHRRPWVAVSGLAQELTDGMRVSAELAGEELLDALRATPATEYLVVEETGEIYGVLSAADVERAFVKAMARPS
ncbi:site-2 protease family protein [Streptomyces sp. NPDC006624]|uniref:site-2 protease family protein n=1 Tax=unclassified Streptomyces TaxID=2593676 RepID=UPI0033AC3BC5